MTAVNFLLKSRDDQQKVFFDNLAIIRKRPAKNAVHDLRVSIKKLRSYLRLQHKLTKEKWEYSFVPVKLLFATLGKFRDFDMSLSLLKKYKDKEQEFFPDFKKYLQVNRSLSRKWAIKAIKNFTEEELTQALQLNTSFNQLTDEELGKKIKQYSAGILKTTASLAKNFRKEAHEIRKLLKDMYYWLRIYPPYFPHGLIHIKNLERVLNQLGFWQDLFIFRKKLTHFRKEFLPGESEQKALVKNFEQMITDEQDVLLDKVKNSLKKISINKKGN